MSNTIKLKRGSGSDPSASDLVVGELALRTDNGKIFTKKDNGSVAEISGGGGIDDGDKGDITVSNSGDTFTIDNGVVSAVKIADDAVTQAKIADDAVGTDQIASGSITSARIADGAIVNADINASAAIAGSKISPTFTSNLNIQNTNPSLSLTDTNNNSDFKIVLESGLFRIQDITNGNVSRFTIASNGTATFTQNLNANAGLDVTGNITATGSITAVGASDVDGSITCDDIIVAGALLHEGDTNTLVHFTANDEISLKTNGSTRLKAHNSGIDVTGNLGVSGTVDGVDIAARNTLFGGLTSSSGVLTNGVTGTTQSASDNTTKVATTAYVTTAISNLINGAPSALDTLNELAAAMNDDAAFSTTVTNSLATKMPLAGGQFTGNITFSGSQTVDGRDLSADGTKLDGIESGATADQTKSDIDGLGVNAATVTVSDESSDTSCNVLFAPGASGDKAVKSGSNLTFNSSSGLLVATTFSGSGASLTSLNASNISSGTIPHARI